MQAIVCGLFGGFYDDASYRPRRTSNSGTRKNSLAKEVEQQKLAEDLLNRYEIADEKAFARSAIKAMSGNTVLAGTESLLIGSLRRSGGTLICRLFDGHPACSVYPFEYWHMKRKAKFRWDSNFLFPLLPSEMKLRACGFHATYGRKLRGWHSDAQCVAHRKELAELAADSSSAASLYWKASELYFRFFHAEPLRERV